jgi:hypothetical protein
MPAKPIQFVKAKCRAANGNNVSRDRERWNSDPKKNERECFDAFWLRKFDITG